MMVDLHAADVDQLRAARALGGEALQRLLEAGRMNGAPVDVHVPRAQRAGMAGFGQTDRIEDIERNAVLARGARHFLLAKLGGLGAGDDGARQ